MPYCRRVKYLKNDAAVSCAINQMSVIVSYQHRNRVYAFLDLFLICLFVYINVKRAPYHFCTHKLWGTLRTCISFIIHYLLKMFATYLSSLISKWAKCFCPIEKKKKKERVHWLQCLMWENVFHPLSNGVISFAWYNEPLCGCFLVWLRMGKPHMPCTSMRGLTSRTLAALDGDVMLWFEINCEL